MKHVFCGIYKISSKVHPDRCYIGSATDIKGKRWSRHRKELRLGTHNRILQNHVNKYGINDLMFTILEECPRNKLLEREQYYIDNDIHHGYFNVVKTAGSNFDYKPTEETKEKIRKTLSGTKRPPFSDEWLKNMSESHKGKPFIRRHQHYKKGEPSAFKGHKHTDESNKKNREAHLGHSDWAKKSVESRRKNGNMMERDEKGRFKKRI